MRWPVEPLLDLRAVNQRSICRALHVSGSTYRRLLAHGLTDWQADRAAIRLGTLPHLVWPGWVDAGLGPLDHQYLAGGWRQAWLWQETA